MDFDTPTGTRERLYSPRYAQALAWAAEMHAWQARKGSGVAYVSHLLRVSSLVWDAGGTEDQAIAGVLHDVVEDTDATFDDVRDRFGNDVAGIVEACTDAEVTPKPPWWERKRAHLAHLEEVSTDVLVVVAADKTDNIESVVADHANIGPAVWDLFKTGREGTVWYYAQMHGLLGRRLGQEHTLVKRLGAGRAQLEQLP